MLRGRDWSGAKVQCFYDNTAAVEVLDCGLSNDAPTALFVLYIRTLQVLG